MPARPGRGPRPGSPACLGPVPLGWWLLLSKVQRLQHQEVTPCLPEASKGDEWVIFQV